MTMRCTDCGARCEVAVPAVEDVIAAGFEEEDASDLGECDQCGAVMFVEDFESVFD